MATNSMFAIEVQPICRKNKGDWYLMKWWNAAKKWNLLTGRLKTLSDSQDAYKAEQEALKAESTPPVSINEVPDSLNNNLAPDGGNKRLLSAAMSSISSTLATAIAAASSTTQSASNRLGSVVEVKENSTTSNSSHLNSHKNDLEDINYVSDNEIYYDEDDVIMDSASANSVPLRALHEICCNHRARVICIGDVHGCADELCELLRKVNYLPGDLVLLLGDLVAKGPKSKAVIRLAMDIGAVSVRGNHDHEVLRQGIAFSKKTGKFESSAERKAALQNVHEEHLKIALQLSVAEFEWLCQLPYFISSLDLGKLFVHAGFQAGVKLAEQHPWAMMTMRSLLADGRATCRGLLKMPWANNWTGPQTVYFGHDAARGLQIHPHAMGLDTGCVYGGNLTAILLPDEVLVSVPSSRVYRDYRKADTNKLYSNGNENG
eukprot:CAMPEP_0170058668 /NCGR_PEP_ID=MMETSP0019_2-20121128/1206_1 /TAXON_ID=98059 /ORGANISM="Dinobryon sp., Strain UTEXLB2267" /LENGTH=431 /DNA_ID=CAMNT_0010263669 /DNA_START=425 /DNA_END=1720 /DNA_ORIENTATION=+